MESSLSGGGSQPDRIQTTEQICPFPHSLSTVFTLGNMRTYSMFYHAIYRSFILVKHNKIQFPSQKQQFGSHRSISLTCLLFGIHKQFTPNLGDNQTSA